jgi:hypothetical protein
MHEHLMHELVSVLLAQQPVQQTAPRHNSHTRKDELGRAGQGNVVHFRHLQQLPVKLTPAAWHLFCQCTIRSNWHSGIEHVSDLQVDGKLC